MVTVKISGFRCSRGERRRDEVKLREFLGCGTSLYDAV